MIKKLVYSIAMVAGLSACNGDYDDWAQPQHNEAETAAEKFALAIQPVSDLNIDFSANDVPETIQLFTTNVDEGATAQYILSLTGEGASKCDTIIADAEGKVKTADISAAVEDMYGKAPTERTITATPSAQVKVNVSGSNVYATKEGTPFSFKAKLNAPLLSEAYYLVGDMFNVKDGDGNVTTSGWSADGMKKFDHSTTNVYDDPVFTIKFETTAENQYWKIIPQRNIDMGNFWNEDNGVLGVALDGDAAFEGFLVTTAPKAGKIEKPGKYIMTINVLDGTYKIEEQPLELYMTGSEYGWGATWVPMTPIWGSDVDFWTVVYLKEGEMFKFAPQADWGNDFGAQATINDVAGAGIVGSDTNLKCTNAGWYLLHIVNGDERKIDILAPKVYLMGETAGEWAINDSHLFTVPATADGEFVSPAFAKDAELRMCVSIEGFDWWKTEFIIADGKIDFRGRGGDQARLNVTAGQKAYLNFTKGTGEVR